MPDTLAQQIINYGNSVQASKNAIAAALTAKGQTASGTDALASYAPKIANIRPAFSLITSYAALTGTVLETPDARSSDYLYFKTSSSLYKVSLSTFNVSLLATLPTTSNAVLAYVNGYVYVFIKSNINIYRVDVNTGAITNYTHDAYAWVAACAFGNFIVLAGSNGAVKLWSTETNSVVAAATVGTSNMIGVTPSATDDVVWVHAPSYIYSCPYPLLQARSCL